MFVSNMEVSALQLCAVREFVSAVRHLSHDEKMSLINEAEIKFQMCLFTLK